MYLNLLNSFQMGADWYSPFVLYGCSVYITTSYNSTLRRLEKCMKKTDFQVACMLPEFHSRMEYMNDTAYDNMTSGSIIVVGFVPSNTMHENCERAEALKTLLASDAFSGWTFDLPQFHTGIDWEPRDDEDNADNKKDEDTYIPAKTLTTEDIHKMFF